MQYFTSQGRPHTTHTPHRALYVSCFVLSILYVCLFMVDPVGPMVQQTFTIRLHVYACYTKSSVFSKTQSTQSTQSSVALRRPVPPGQPDHMPTRGPVCSSLGSARTRILPVPAYAERTTFQCADKAVNR